MMVQEMLMPWEKEKEEKGTKEKASPKVHPGISRIQIKGTKDIIPKEDNKSKEDKAKVPQFNASTVEDSDTRQSIVHQQKERSTFRD